MPRIVVIVRASRPETRIVQGDPLIIYGDGGQTRDFTHVDNIVAANLRACECAEVGGRVFNVATGRGTSLLHLVKTLETLLNKSATRVFQPARVGDVEHSYAAIDEAQRALGYEPSVGFVDGLRSTVRAMRQQMGGA